MSKRAPALPTSVWSQLGPIPVRLVADLKSDEGDIVLGLWKPLVREIHIRDGMHPHTALVTCAHEWVHALLWDAGVNLPGEQEETVCDVVAAGVIADLLSNHARPNK